MRNIDSFQSRDLLTDLSPVDEIFSVCREGTWLAVDAKQTALAGMIVTGLSGVRN